MKNNATTKALLFKSKTLKNGEHPIMLRVIKERKAKYISTGYSCDPKLWDFANEVPSKKHPEKQKLETLLKLKVAELSSQVLDLDLQNKEFTADTVIQKVRRKKVTYSAFAYFDEVVKQLRTANRIGNAEVYQTCKNVLLTFSQKPDLAFSEIDYSFITKFENYCKEKGWKENSISSYLRTLRALLNRAINENIITADNYPFKQYKIGKLSTTTQKRAIRIEQIEAIEALELEPNSRLKNSQNIFLFSFYTMGTNLVDIASLTWQSVQDGRIKYTRSKTHKPYNLVLSDKAKQILTYYDSIKTDEYIFPIYSKDRHVTAQQKANRLHKVMQQVNEDLKEIAKLCGINETITTYVARHSAATILKRKGVSTTVISELLGHETEGITQVYLDSFESPVLDTAISLL
jgi:site-specific recombinase XerD